MSGFGQALLGLLVILVSMLAAQQEMTIWFFVAIVCFLTGFVITIKGIIKMH
jgi:hypothetical protein